MLWGGDTVSHSIETIYDLWRSFGLTHPCSTTLGAPDHSTSIIMRQCNDKGHISHPQEKPQSTSTGGRGGRGARGTLHWGGGGGGACQTWIIYIYLFTFTCHFYKCCFLPNDSGILLMPFQRNQNSSETRVDTSQMPSMIQAPLAWGEWRDQVE